jgi:hypothetical protein
MNSRLLAIKMTGRSATAAVYFGRELHYTEVRQLASDLVQAKDSVVAFSSSLIEHFHLDSAVTQSSIADTRAKALTAAMLDLFRDKAIPYWTIEMTELFGAYGEMSLTSTHGLRKVVKGYWPHIIDEQDDDTCLDAAALGLYVQTDRMLSDNSPISQ